MLEPSTYFATVESSKYQIVARPAKSISNGMAVCQDAFLEIEPGLPRQFYTDLAKYIQSGQVKICIARLKLNGEQA